jgi:NADH-quinone oxidoreductase subunit G
VAIVASARQTNEELFLLSKLATKLGRVSDSVPRIGEATICSWRGQESEQQRRAPHGMRLPHGDGINLPKIAAASKSGAIKTLIVFGEDVTKHGISAELLGKLETLVVSDILPNKTTAAAHYLLPGCAHAEKRGSFTNVKGRVQRS